jgi:hypothetical protein
MYPPPTSTGKPMRIGTSKAGMTLLLFIVSLTKKTREAKAGSG